MSMVPIDFGGLGHCRDACFDAVCPTQTLLHFFSFACLAWECAMMYIAAQMLMHDKTESAMAVDWKMHAFCWGLAGFVGVTFAAECAASAPEERLHNVMVVNL